jgi:large subunit ribosomal protein L30
MSKILLRQFKSASGHKADQSATVRALGFTRLQQVVEKEDTPQIRGMIFKVRHLVEVVDKQG